MVSVTNKVNACVANQAKRTRPVKLASTRRDRGRYTPSTAKIARQSAAENAVAEAANRREPSTARSAEQSSLANIAPVTTNATSSKRYRMVLEAGMITLL